MSVELNTAWRATLSGLLVVIAVWDLKTKRVPHLMDRWGTAGPPSPEIRKSMAGQPDPGYQG